MRIRLNIRFNSWQDFRASMREANEKHPVQFALVCSAAGYILLCLLAAAIRAIWNIDPTDNRLAVALASVYILAVNIWLLCICARLRDENSIIDIPKYVWYTVCVIVLVLLIVVFAGTLIYGFFRP